MFDTSTQSLKVWSSGMWHELPLYESPTLSFDAEEAIDTIIEHLKGQRKLTTLAAKYSIVAEALGQLEVAMKLCENLSEDADDAA